MLFGSTAFDSFKDSTRWVQFIQGNDVPHGRPAAQQPRRCSPSASASALVFALGTMLTGVGRTSRARELPDQFAHSIVPIVVGYIVAHYLTYLSRSASRR